jgi:uncharacterized protein (TIGR00106 family)
MHGLLEFSVVPLGVGSSVSPYVARCVELVEASGLDYQLHAMGTLVEGDHHQLLALLERCLDALAADCDRITCSAKIDLRRDSRDRLRGKIASVEEKLGRRLRTSAE